MGQRLLAADRPVEPAERRRIPAAGGGQRLESERHQQLRGTDVPGIGEEQRRATLVEGEEPLRPLDLLAHCRAGYSYAEVLTTETRTASLGFAPIASGSGSIGRLAKVATLQTALLPLGGAGPGGKRPAPRLSEQIGAKLEADGVAEQEVLDDFAADRRRR